MNLNEISELHRSLLTITDPKEYQMVVQTLLANLPDILHRLYSPQVVIAAQTDDLKIVHFGPFRNVSLDRNQIVVNDATRNIGMMNVNSGIWYIHGQPFQIVSVKTYRPESEYHRNLIQL